MNLQQMNNLKPVRENPYNTNSVSFIMGGFLDAILFYTSYDYDENDTSLDSMGYSRHSFSQGLFDYIKKYCDDFENTFRACLNSIMNSYKHTDNSIGILLGQNLYLDLVDSGISIRDSDYKGLIDEDCIDQMEMYIKRTKRTVSILQDISFHTDVELIHV